MKPTDKTDAESKIQTIAELTIASFADVAPPDSAALERLGSSAVARGQTRALRRHLAAGLDPNAFFQYGIFNREVWGASLLERAAEMGQMECFKILAEAGAQVSMRVMEICASENEPWFLRHLVETGRFEPSGGPKPGMSWIDYARINGAVGACEFLLQTICERERVDLNLMLDRAPAPRQRRSL